MAATCFRGRSMRPCWLPAAALRYRRLGDCLECWQAHLADKGVDRRQITIHPHIRSIKTTHDALGVVVPASQSDETPC